jgi:phosphoribosyl-ATP pyrophosphohydrolase
MKARSSKPKAKATRRLKPSARKTKEARKLKPKRTAKARAQDANPKRLKSTDAEPNAALSGGEDRVGRLFAGISQVRAGARKSARTSKLLFGGTAKMAQKVIEEAAEVGIEAIRGERSAFINESADLLYNLVALWTELGIEPKDVWKEMDRREALLGIAEKLPKVE